ncbi:MAG: RagB/SusD family nutrient uptake outer membrane protein [Saprospiraceae bacterium]|nr:RagB/SusD family nutrient uptake outer membrane protein [Saprospiraceae bacterium]
MMNKSANHLIKATLFLTVVLLAGCFDDLDTVPLDDDVVTSAKVYDDPNAYRQVLAKLYAGLAVSGQQGPHGQSDISGIDEGFGQYTRGYWYHQELTTDEAVIGWNDQTIKDFHEQDWTASDNFINAFYSRIFYQISLCNEFIRETTDAKLADRGVEGSLYSDVQAFRAEARFLRALSYWHALDLFRNVPFVTEEDEVGAFFPEQVDATTLFTYIESELKDIESTLVGPRQNEYGRADQAAVWVLLAKLYLNAEVYTGTARYADCQEYCDKVINAGYELEPEYEHLFMADNHRSNEIIFPVTYDGISTRTWGGTTFIIHAAVGGDMNPSDFGIDGGWNGTRTTSALVEKFPAVGSGEPLVTPNEGNPNYPVVYMPGAYQGWDPANEKTVLTSPNDDGTFEAYMYFPDANTEFKITTGPNWDVNYGDNEMDGILDLNGSNLVAADAGVYKVNVDLNNLTYTTLKTDWGLIGSATPGGWDADTDMTYDPEEEAFVLDLYLIAGEIKFRANDDWAINFGDNGADALLDAGGDNIQIPADGNYLIKLFLGAPDYTYSIAQTSFDFRAMFFTQNQNLEITDISQFNEGYAITKFKNVTSSGAVGSDLTFPDTDFPMFRLADVYLMFAEAVVRQSAGRQRALQLVNAVRERAYGNSTGNIQESEMTLEFLLDERARELYWECHRRTDLVRFGQFTEGNYAWPWKGGAPEGVPVSSNFNVFPIPANDLGANPNLVQNPGY